MPTPPRPGAPRPGTPRPLGSRPAGQTSTSRKRESPLLRRAKGILLQPGAEWQVIAGEFTTVGAIYRGYVLRLAAIPAVCQILGYAVWGVPALYGGTIHVSPSTALQSGVAFYVAQLVAVYALALVINGLAPTFGGTSNMVQAFKVAAYASTASWVAGVFVLVPGGQWLAPLLGLYTLYLFYTGLTPVMKSSRDKLIGYAVLTNVAAIFLYIVIKALTTVFLPPVTA